MKLFREALGLFLLGIHKMLPPKDRGVLSIYFHKPDKQLFRKLVAKVLKEGYTVISVKELEKIIRNKEDTSKKAIITFDDGSMETLDLIRSIQEFNIPVAMFIPTEPVESGNFWWNYAFIPGQEKVSGIRKADRFKDLPEEIFDQKIRLLRSSFTISRTCIALEELKRINALDLITIGGHTVTHPILENCSFERQEKELKESKSILSKWLNKSVDYFAFPNGDYNNNTLLLLKKHGYKLAFTTKPGRIDPHTVDPLQIPRYSISDDGGYFENLAKLKGAWQRFSK